MAVQPAIGQVKPPLYSAQFESQFCIPGFHRAQNQLHALLNTPQGWTISLVFEATSLFQIRQVVQCVAAQFRYAFEITGDGLHGSQDQRIIGPTLGICGMMQAGIMDPGAQIVHVP